MAIWYKVFASIQTQRFRKGARIFDSASVNCTANKALGVFCANGSSNLNSFGKSAPVQEIYPHSFPPRKSNPVSPCRFLNYTWSSTGTPAMPAV